MHHNVNTGREALASIVRDEGVSGLWRGTQFNVLRTVSFSGTLLAVNSKVKELLSTHAGVYLFGAHPHSHSTGVLCTPAVCSPSLTLRWCTVYSHRLLTLRTHSHSARTRTLHITPHNLTLIHGHTVCSGRLCRGETPRRNERNARISGRYCGLQPD